MTYVTIAETDNSIIIEDKSEKEAERYSKIYHFTRDLSDEEFEAMENKTPNLSKEEKKERSEILGRLESLEEDMEWLIDEELWDPSDCRKFTKIAEEMVDEINSLYQILMVSLIDNPVEDEDEE